MAFEGSITAYITADISQYSKATESISGITQSSIGKASNVASSSTSSMISKISGIVGKLGNEVKPSLEQVGSNVSEPFSKAGGQIQRIMSSIGEKIPRPFKRAFTSVSSIGESSTKSLGNSLPSNIEKGTSKVGGILNRLKTSFSNFGNGANESLKPLNQGFTQAHNGVLDFAKGMGVFKLVDTAIGAVTGSLGSAISRIDTLNNSTRTFQNMGFSADQVKVAMDGLQKSIQGLPTPMDQAVQGVQMLSASTGDLGKSQQIFAALNDGILGFGGSTADVQNAVLQLSQAFAGGRVDAQTWNSMLNSNLGPALNAIAKQMGITTGELKEKLSDGTISVTQFQDSLIDLDKNGGGGLKSLHTIAQDSTSGIGTSIENMKTAITRGVADMIQSFDQFVKDITGMGIADIITKIGQSGEQGLKKLAGVIKEIEPPIKNVISFVAEHQDVFKALAVGIGVAYAAFKTLKTISTISQTISAVGAAAKGSGEALSLLAKSSKIAAAAQTVLNTVMSLNPFVIVAVAIAALVAGLVYFFTQTKTGKKIVADTWKAIQNAISSAAEAVKKAWEGVTQFFSDLWSGIKDGVSGAWDSLKESSSDTWNSIKDSTESVWNSLKKSSSDTWDSVKEQTTSSWGSLKESASTSWNAVKDAISTVWDSLKEAVMKKASELGEALSPIWTTITQVAKTAWDNMVTLATDVFTILKNVILGPILLLIDLVSGNFTKMKDDAAAIWNNITTSASNIFNLLKENISNIINNLLTIATNVWNTMKKVASDSWNNLKDSVIDIIDSLKENVSNVISSVGDFVSNAWDTMKTTAINTWNGLKDGVINIVDNIKTAVPNMIENARDSVANIWESMKNTASNVWNGLMDAVINTVNSIKEGISNGFQNAKETASSIFEGIKEAISNAIQTASNVVSNTIESIKGFFNSLGNIDLFSIGSDIIQGLINGIHSMVDSVMTTISNIGKSISDTISDVLHIGSPSKVMAKIGVWTGQGLVNGLESMQRDVDRQSENYANTIIQSQPKTIPQLAESGISRSLANSKIDGMQEAVLNAPNSAINLTIEENWNGEEVYHFVKNKDNRAVNISKVYGEKRGYNGHTN